MGTIQLVNRSAGQVILANFYNDIHSALEGDFVGRDSSGNAVSGNNCGTAAYPWGVGYFNQIVLSGSSLSNAASELPPYQILSGKTRSGSNQPAFLVPAGSAATYNLLATSVNLTLSINGVVATWTVDKNSIPVTTAPSTQNTATVNDATAAGQAATRIWGEYGSAKPYYPIALSSVGTNISALVGTWQAFKIVGTGSAVEYFIAYVESTTSLSRAFRGFFFDSSGNPVKRTTFSNSATITLMNLGWVFADQDGTTVDTIFTGAGVNNTPKFAYTAPSSPATGDYWFDQGNQVWKRWSGSAWVVVNRIPVGLVVADSTNCVAARSFDFTGLVRADNTVELAWASNTVIKGAGLFERINVMGKRISFQTSRATWDTASNLAGSSERYNSSVQASTNEYFYITDQGDTKISDIEPYWRPDLLGYYHPFNPWRCAGLDTTDLSANFLAVSLAGIVPKLNGAPTVQTFTSTGTTTGYLFTISTSTTCAVGDTYTNNGNTYTVLGALSAQSGQVLFMSGASAPTSSGTLSRASGSGTSSVTFSAKVACATYTPPAGALYIKVRLVGGGGGGNSGGTAAHLDGGDGTSSFFGPNLLICTGGKGASQTGGSPTVNSPATKLVALAGGDGSGGNELGASATNTQYCGAPGGNNALGGAGAGGPYGSTGGSAVSNSGGGGGGSGSGSGNSTSAGGWGGGAGAYLEALISALATSYPYVIGGGGAGGTTGIAAGNGAAGFLEIIEYYQ